MRSKSGGAGKYILFGCGGAFLLAGLGVGGCVMLIFRMTKAPVDASEKFLAAVAAGDFPAAQSVADPLIAAGVEGMAKSSPATWGKSWTITGRNVATNNGTTTAVVVASVAGTDGKSRAVTLTLREDSNAWKVTRVDVDQGTVLSETIRPYVVGPSSGGSLRFRLTEVTRVADDDTQWGVKVAYDVDGLAWEKKGEKYRVKASTGYKIVNPKGDVILDKPIAGNVDGEGEQPMANWVLTLRIPKASGPGAYVVKVSVNDDISGSVAVHDFKFNLP